MTRPDPQLIAKLLADLRFGSNILPHRIALADASQRQALAEAIYPEGAKQLAKYQYQDYIEARIALPEND